MQQMERLFAFLSGWYGVTPERVGLDPSKVREDIPWQLREFYIRFGKMFDVPKGCGAGPFSSQDHLGGLNDLRPELVFTDDYAGDFRVGGVYLENYHAYLAAKKQGHDSVLKDIRVRIDLAGENQGVWYAYCYLNHAEGQAFIDEDENAVSLEAILTVIALNETLYFHGNGIWHGTIDYRMGDLDEWRDYFVNGDALEVLWDYRREGRPTLGTTASPSFLYDPITETLIALFTFSYNKKNTLLHMASKTTTDLSLVMKDARLLGLDNYVSDLDDVGKNFWW